MVIDHGPFQPTLNENPKPLNENPKPRFEIKLNQKIPFLPQNPIVEQSETCTFDVATKTLAYSTVVAMTNMPSGDCFTANTQVRFVPDGKSACICRVSYETKFIKSTWSGPAISRVALGLNKSKWTEWLGFARDYILEQDVMETLPTRIKPKVTFWSITRTK